MDARLLSDKSINRVNRIFRITGVAVIGVKEVESNALSIRTRATGDLGLMEVSKVIERIEQAIANFTLF